MFYLQRITSCKEKLLKCFFHNILVKNVLYSEKNENDYKLSELY